MYDLIYANGDSYTAGSGLAQEMYYDLPPLNGHEVTPELRTKVYAKKDKCKGDWSNTERQRAYPATLGFFANTKVINNAQGGAGLGNIAFNSTKDLVDLSKKYNRILAVIGLTNPQRVFFPRPPNNTLLFGNPLNNYSKLEQAILDKYAFTFSNFDLEIYSIIHFLGLVQIIEWMDNVDLILIETPAYKTKDADPNKDYDVIKKNVAPLIFDSLVPDYKKSMQIHTGCNHVIKDYHDDLAKKIYKKLWRQKN